MKLLINFLLNFIFTELSFFKKDFICKYLSWTKSISSKANLLRAIRYSSLVLGKWMNFRAFSKGGMLSFLVIAAGMGSAI